MISDEALEKMAERIAHCYYDGVTGGTEKGLRYKLAIQALSTVRDAQLGSLPSDDDLENEAAYFHLDHPKYSASQMFFEGARWVRDKLRSQLVTANPEKHAPKGKLCPCGGIILADTDEFTTPLCSSCYEETIASRAQPMTEDQIRAVHADWMIEMRNQTVGGSLAIFLAAARAAEKYHGIKK